MTSYRPSEETEDAIVAFVASYTGANGYAPTLRELAEGIDRSLSVTHHHVARLVDEGRLTHRPESPRTLRVVSS